MITIIVRNAVTSGGEDSCDQEGGDGGHPGSGNILFLGLWLSVQ